jgi:hypothetical protein
MKSWWDEGETDDTKSVYKIYFSRLSTAEGEVPNDAGIWFENLIKDAYASYCRYLAGEDEEENKSERWQVGFDSYRL